MTRAIVFTNGPDYARADRCIDYLREHRYDFKGLVQDWQTALKMMRDDEVSVVIAADPSELPPDRKPRLEFVSHPPRPPKPATNEGRYWDERTRVIRRGTWEG